MYNLKDHLSFYVQFISFLVSRIVFSQWAPLGIIEALEKREPFALSTSLRSGLAEGLGKREPRVGGLYPFSGLEEGLEKREPGVIVYEHSGLAEGLEK